MPILIGDISDQVWPASLQAALAAPAFGAAPDVTATLLRPLPILQASLDAIAAQTSVLLSTAGPFAL